MVLSALGAWSFRGYMAFWTLRGVVLWYDTVPHLGAVLFVSGWWARDTTGDPDVGGTIAFRFGPGGFDMNVVELVPGKRVLWEVVDGPAEWIGRFLEASACEGEEERKREKFPKHAARRVALLRK